MNLQCLKKGRRKNTVFKCMRSEHLGLLAALQNLMKSFHPLFSMYFLFMPLKKTSIKTLDYQSSHFDYELYHSDSLPLIEIL